MDETVGDTNVKKLGKLGTEYIVVLGEIIFGEVFGSHSTLIIRCLVV